MLLIRSRPHPIHLQSYIRSASTYAYTRLDIRFLDTFSFMHHVASPSYPSRLTSLYYTIPHPLPFFFFSFILQGSMIVRSYVSQLPTLPIHNRTGRAVR